MICTSCSNKVTDAAHTCWIGNIRIQNSESQNSLEKHFEDSAKQFGRIHSTKISLSTNHHFYQCLINFFVEGEAKKSASYFNGALFDGEKLISHYRRIRSLSTPPTNRNNINHIVNNMVCIQNSKYLRCQLEEKLKQFIDIPIEIIEEEKTSNLTCKINCINDHSEVIQKIKEWKVYQFAYKLKFDEYILITDIKNEIIKRCRNYEAFIEFNQNNSEIQVYSFKNDVSNSVLEKIKRFVYEHIICKEQKEIKDNYHYELLKNAFQSTEFVKKNNLEKINFEFNDPMQKERNGSIIISGKKFDFLKINFTKLFEIFSLREKVFLNENIIISSSEFINFQLKHKIQSNLKRKYMILKYSEISKNQKKFVFEVYGFENSEIVREAEEIKFFLSNAKSTLVDVKSFDIVKVKRLLEDFLKNDNEDTSPKNDIYFHEKSKTIFINGTYAEEISQLKESIEKLLNGSREINKTIKIKNCLYNKFLKQNMNALNNLSQNNRNVKIFNFLPNGQNITVRGLKNETEKIIFEIEKLLNEFSRVVEVRDLEIKESEFQYLLKQKCNIEKLKEETSSIITLNAIKKYASLKFQNAVEIELFEGDLTEVLADAYVNPVNVSLNHNDGLAKVILDKAGFSIKQDCDKYIKENVQLQEGRVFVTNSGDLGVKHNSIIIHAAGLILRGGVSFESQNLSQVVRNCLNEANKHTCSSIVIPVVSTCTFTYPLQDAVKIISETVVDYILNNSGCLKKIFLISNEEKVVKAWELVLLYISNVFNIKSDSRAIKNKMPPNERWYWKDDQGNWKAFASEYNILIENKFKEFKESNFSSYKSKFEINISEKKYVIDLINKKQVNLKTKFENNISNEIPNISRYQWNWIDDLNRKIPFSLIQSEMIEKAFNNNEKSIKLMIKRHDNDNFEIYEYEFAKNNRVVEEYLNRKRTYFQGDGIQRNIRTNLKRLIKRELSYLASIEYPEEDFDDCVKNPIKVFIASEKTYMDNAIKRFEDFLKDAYIEEIVTKIELTKNEVENLEMQNDAKISLKEKVLVIKGSPDAINKIKSSLLEIFTQNQNISNPKEWSPMENQNLKICLVASDTDEYKNIYSEVSKSIPNPNIVKIERIQNCWLWKYYQNKKKILKDKGKVYYLVY